MFIIRTSGLIQTFFSVCLFFLINLSIILDTLMFIYVILLSQSYSFFTNWYCYLIKLQTISDRTLAMGNIKIRLVRKNTTLSTLHFYSPSHNFLLVSKHGL